MHSALANMQLFFPAPLGHFNAAHCIMGGPLAGKKYLRWSDIVRKPLSAQQSSAKEQCVLTTRAAASKCVS
jgi:hypothetical protein